MEECILLLLPLESVITSGPSLLKGATSFEDLHTVDGVLRPTFKDAWLRTLFATILLHGTPTSPEELWNQSKDRVCDDLAWNISHLYPNDPNPSSELIHDYGLYLLDQQLMKSGKKAV